MERAQQVKAGVGESGRFGLHDQQTGGHAVLDGVGVGVHPNRVEPLLLEAPGQVAAAAAHLQQPHAHFWRQQAVGGATVMRWDGAAWQPVGDPGFSGSATYLDLALDRQDVPYLAFRDGGNGELASVMRFSGGVWQVVGQRGFSQGYAASISLDRDGQGMPTVAYTDSSDGNKAAAMHYDGSAWQGAGQYGFSYSMAGSTSLRLDGEGVANVAFTDYGAHGAFATVLRYPPAGPPQLRYLPLVLRQAP